MCREAGEGGGVPAARLSRGAAQVGCPGVTAGEIVELAATGERWGWEALAGILEEAEDVGLLKEVGIKSEGARGGVLVSSV